MADQDFYTEAISGRIEATGSSIAESGAAWIDSYTLTRLPGLQESWDAADGDVVRDEIDGFDWAPTVDDAEMFRFFSYMERRSEFLRETRFLAALSQLEDLLEGGAALAPEVPAQVEAVRKSFRPTRLCLVDP